MGALILRPIVSNALGDQKGGLRDIMPELRKSRRLWRGTHSHGRNIKPLRVLMGWSSQAVRRESAKLLYAGSIPASTSNFCYQVAEIGEQVSSGTVEQ